MSEVRAAFEKAKMLGHKKVAGEHSLSGGEIFFTILGVLLIFFGTKAKIPKKLCLPLGIAIIFMGEWIF